MVSVHTGNLLSVAEPSQPTESSIAEIYRIAAPSVMYRAAGNGSIRQTQSHNTLARVRRITPNVGKILVPSQNRRLILQRMRGDLLIRCCRQTNVAHKLYCVTKSFLHRNCRARKIGVVIPPAKLPTATVTGTRAPRMMGLP
jgi:hypothetical protein